MDFYSSDQIHATMQYDDRPGLRGCVDLIYALAEFTCVAVRVKRKCFEGEKWYYSIIISAKEMQPLECFTSKLMSLIGIPDSPLFCAYAKQRQFLPVFPKRRGREPLTLTPPIEPLLKKAIPA